MMSFLIDEYGLIAVLVPVLCTQIAASYFSQTALVRCLASIGHPNRSAWKRRRGYGNGYIYYELYLGLSGFSYYATDYPLWRHRIYARIFLPRQEKQTETIDSISTIQLLTLLLIFWGLYLFVMDSAAGIDPYLSIEVAVIHLSVIGASLFLICKAKLYKRYLRSSSNGREH